MIKALTLTILTASLINSAQAKPLMGINETYLIERSGTVITVASNNISKDGIAKYMDLKTSKMKSIEFSELSKATKKEIYGVKAGEYILLTNKVVDSSRLISRYCEVNNVFENKMAEVGCKIYRIDEEKKNIPTIRLKYIVKDLRSVTAEVSSLDKIKKGEVVELRINTKHAIAGKKVKVLAIFANREVLVEKTGFKILDSKSILFKAFVDRVRISDLNKLD